MGYEFYATSWYITTRGNYAEISGDQLEQYDIYDPKVLNGLIVTIDGEEYEVNAVDCYSVPRSKEQPYRHSFGVLV